MELILDYNRWRCGEDGEYMLGKGTTMLCNVFGFCCCLGLFSTQMDNEVTKELISDVGEPYETNKVISQLSWYDSADDRIYNTELSIKAIMINDDEKTTPEEKIVLLQELFESAGHTIKVINKPKPQIA